MAAQRVAFSGLISGADTLWVTDGTTAGTQNITPAGEIPGWFPQYFGSAGNNIIFQADNLSASNLTPGALTQLYVSDGTAAGTLPVGTVSYSGEAVSFGSLAIFNGSDATGNTGLWVTDGTVAGTKFVTAATSISTAGGGAYQYHSTGAALGSTQAVFRDPSGNLWITDGTAAGTHAVGFAGTIGALWSFDGKVLFTGVTNVVGSPTLYITDGTSAGSQAIDGYTANGAVALTPNIGLFTGSGPAANGVWKSDGTTAGTALVYAISDPITGLAALGTTGKAIFTTSTTVYETDGTTTTPIATVSSPFNLTTFGTEVYFTTKTASNQDVIWVTDGTAAGTHTVLGNGLIAVNDGVEGPYDAVLGGTTTPGGGFSITDVTTGKIQTVTGTPYSGPVAGLTSEYILPTTDQVTVTSGQPNVFIQIGMQAQPNPVIAGIDVSKSNGNNVLDSYANSSFLTDGTGTDQNYLDARGLIQNEWDSIVNFHSGDNITLWGVTQTDFALDWIGDTQGASGYTGLTGVFVPMAKGQPEAAVTLSGFKMADVTDGKLAITYDTIGGTPYASIHAT